ncbi:MAG: ABC transporter ATP-binding protein [Anaerolineales bacterium]|jgi:ABC-2 type transport system ATP-binding protein
MDTTNTDVIHTQGLSKSFKGVKALDALSMQVPKNSIYGFLGPNGAGKSTAIKLLLGLIRPTAGKAKVFGQDVVQDSLAVRRRIGYLAQEPRYYEYMTARQTLRYTARYFYRGPNDLLEARVEEMLELTGLGDKADRPIKGYSGGERQRLGIAQAQVNYPDLLILDEPAASLDPMGRHDVLLVMETLRKYTTIFYSTHILDDVQRVSDRVLILNHGRLVAEAPIEELLDGNGAAAVYQVALKGETGAAQARVAARPWVQSLNAEQQNGLTTWQVSVTDSDAAEDELLYLVLAEHDVRVTNFGRKTYNLEEVFLNLVNEDQLK